MLATYRASHSCFAKAVPVFNLPANRGLQRNTPSLLGYKCVTNGQARIKSDQLGATAIKYAN